MMQTNIDLDCRDVPRLTSDTSLAEAKKWIGHPMILRRRWLGFAPGTRCRVMCVADFGDGLLLWLVTDDEHARDVDQLAISFVTELFSDMQAELPSQNMLCGEVKISQSVN